MSKLYTKRGDNGITNLYDMRDIGKHSLIIEVLGDLDELSSSIGLVAVLIARSSRPKTERTLRWIQHKLLDIGSDIATIEKRDNLTVIDKEDVKKLENCIDEYSAQSRKLTEFILPGYDIIDSHLHVCRSICRRAERHMWALRRSKGPRITTNNQPFIFMNRLSDFFFAAAILFSGGLEITRSEANNLDLE